MADAARGYLDALRALSGDSLFAEARHNLIKGPSDATLEDYIKECLSLNTSRVVREHIIKSLLDVADHDHAQPKSDGGYLDALRALSGNPAFAAARRNLIKQASDATLDETIKEGLRHCTSRTDPERVLMFLLDAVTEQTRSRAQSELLVKEEVGPEPATVLFQGETAEQNDAPQNDAPITNQVSAPMDITRKRSSFAADQPIKRARTVNVSEPPHRHVTAEHEPGSDGSYIKSEADEAAEEGEIIEAAHQSAGTETQAPLHPTPIRVRLCLSDRPQEEWRNLGRIPADVRTCLLEKLADDYGYIPEDRASYSVILQYGDSSRSAYRCMNTLLHGQGKCKWKYGNRMAACDYCVQTGRACARLGADKKGYAHFVVHSLPPQLEQALAQ